MYYFEDLKKDCFWKHGAVSWLKKHELESQVAWFESPLSHEQWILVGYLISLLKFAPKIMTIVTIS